MIVLTNISWPGDPEVCLEQCVNLHHPYLLIVIPIFLSVLSKLVRHLDKRILKKSNGGAFRRKECVVSSPSVTEAPGTAPSWAVYVVQPSQPQDETLSSSMHMTSCNIEVDSD